MEPAGCYLTPTESPSECISTPTECNLTPLQFMVQKWGVNQHPIFNSVLMCNVPPRLALAAHRSTKTIYFSIVRDTHTRYSKRHSYLYMSTLNNTHENVQSTYVPQGSLRQCPITSHMYNFLCLHSAQTLIFCSCVHAEYNNNCLEYPLGPAVGVLCCVYWV